MQRSHTAVQRDLPIEQGLPHSMVRHVLNFWQVHMAPGFAFGYFLHIFSYYSSAYCASLQREDTVEAEPKRPYLKAPERCHADEK